MHHYDNRDLGVKADKLFKALTAGRHFLKNYHTL